MKRILFAVALCAITAISGAWTLQWDPGSDWPAGTTVNACVNGVCVNGITGNSQSFNETYLPGTVLHGTAQAVPPAGYQCGDPLGPCPPSAIEEIAQTIPSDQSVPSRSAWVNEGVTMARPVLDTAHVTTSTGTATARTFSHTVPSGTNLLVVFLQGWIVGESNPPSAITWNGTALTRITLSSGSFWHLQHGIWYLANPSAATANIVISGGYSPLDDGGIITAVNLSGVDTSVGTSGIRATSLSGADTRTTVTLSPTTGSNDLIVSYFSQQSSTSTTGQTYGGTSGTQSVLASVGYNLDAVFLTTSAPTASGQNVTFLENSASNYPSGLAISIAGTASGTSYSYSATGGIASGGSSSIKRTFSSPATGGIVSSGLAAIKRTFANQPTGGITTGGSATVSKSSGTSYTATGGVTTGGAATLKRTQASTANGGISTGGTAPLKFIKTATASGGITTGGSAALKRTQAIAATGGITTGGSATLKRTQTVAATGGITTGGSASLKRTQATTATGGIVTGGTAGLKRTQKAVSAGGIATGGTATASKSSPGQNSYMASGGVTTGGAATLKRTQKAVGAGGIATGGTATLKRIFARLASGGLSTGGAALLKQVHAYLASGGLATGGAASVTLIAGAFSHVASGGIAAGGSASLRILLHYLASGGVTIGGTASAFIWSSVMALPHGDPAFARLSSVAAMERITPLARVA